MGRDRTLELVGGSHGLPRAEVTRIQRQRLLDAMAKVVAEVGYEDTTVERVLVQAGVSRRTFYELFSDKEDCFLAAYDQAMRQALEIVRNAYLSCSTPERQIECALEAFLRFCAREPELARMCIVEVFAAGPRARAMRADAMAKLAELMEEALHELRGDRELGRLAAQALVGGVHELIYEPIDKGETADLPAMAEQIVESQIAPLVRV